MKDMTIETAIANLKADIKYWEDTTVSTEHLSMAIKALQQEPCEDCISREAAIRIAEQGQIHGYEWQFKKLTILPAVTPKTKIGHWIFVDKAKEHAHCSECGYGNVDLVNGKPHNYCENCGAKMEMAEG